MYNNNYVSQGASWLNIINLYKKSGVLSDPPESGEMGTKVYQFPLSSFSSVKREAFLAGALTDGDGPGNGGGSPSALTIYSKSMFSLISSDFNISSCKIIFRIGVKKQDSRPF